MVLLLKSGSLISVLLGLVLMGLLLICFSSTCPSTLPALFPTEVRYGGLSISFNIFVSAFAGTVSLVMSALVLATGDLKWPGYYLMIAERGRRAHAAEAEGNREEAVAGVCSVVVRFGGRGGQGQQVTA